MVSLLSHQRLLEQADGSAGQMLCVWVPHDGRSKGNTACLRRLKHVSRSHDFHRATYGVFPSKLEEAAGHSIDRAIRRGIHVGRISLVGSAVKLTASSVVLMAILRLWSGLEYNNRGILMYDYTFWLPKVRTSVSEACMRADHLQVLIFSCLEGKNVT